MMYSIRSQKWAGLVLLTGLSKAFAGALPDDFWSSPFDSQLLAVAPDSFTDSPLVETDLLYEEPPYGLYSEYNDPNAEFGYDPNAELGYDPNAPYDLLASSDVDPLYSEFEVAQATECWDEKRGLVLKDAIYAAPQCSGGYPGCNFNGKGIPFAPNLATCAPEKQLCCDETGVDTVSQCRRVAQPTNWLEQIGSWGEGLGNLLQGVPASAGGAADWVPGLKKRQGGFCPAPNWDQISK
jgi:hypothetical protein